MPRRSSSVVGREFGKSVRNAVDQTRMTHRKIAEMLGWDESKLSDLVRGKGGVSETELLQLLAFCRIPPAEVRRLVALFRESRERGWLVFSDGVQLGVRNLVAQERLANKIVAWSINLIPGRLQTADYMWGLYEGAAHHDEIDYEALIAERLTRREVFHWTRQFVFFVHEHALRLPVGGPDVMKDQLLHILAMAQRSYVTVRVVPASIGAHAGASGSFVLLNYEKFEPVVYTDSEHNSLFLEDKASLARYTKIVTVLDRQALNPEQSNELIRGLLC
jgi:predicted XRE-type DNA-binding protein